MNRLLLTAVLWARSPRAHGVANVVAPSNPLGRLGSAVAVTAVLVGVQVGLVAAHAGSDLCRSVSVCHAALGAHGAIPQTHRTGGAPAAPDLRSTPPPTRSSGPASALATPASQPQTAAATQTVALRTFTPLLSGVVTAARAKPTAVVKVVRQTSTRHASTTVRQHPHRHLTVAAARRVKVKRPASVRLVAQTHPGLARGH